MFYELKELRYLYKSPSVTLLHCS